MRKYDHIFLPWYTSVKIKNLITNKHLEKSCLLMENLSTASPITCYSGTGTTKLGLITNKRELARISLYIIRTFHVRLIHGPTPRLP